MTGVMPHDGKHAVAVAQVSYCTILRKLSLILAALVLAFLGQTLTMSFVPGELTNSFTPDFGSGKALNCAQLTHKPEACIQAADRASVWAGYAGWGSSALSLFLAPTLGALADCYGRKPFLVICAGLMVLQSGAFVLFHYRLLSGLVFMIINNGCSVVSPLGVSLAASGDLLPRPARTTAAGIIVGAFSVAFIIGPFAGAIAPLTVLAFAAVICSVLAVLLLSFMTEPLAKDLQKKFTCTVLNPVANFGILLTKPMFRALTVTLLLQTMCTDGVQTLILFYIDVTYTFTPAAVNLLMMVLGIMALVAQVGALQFLKAHFGSKTIVLLALACGLASNLLLVLVHIPAVLFIQAGTVMAVSTLVYPAISAVKSSNVSKQQQGQIQGALVGVKTIGGGFAPLLFAKLFKAFTQPGLYYPEAPFVLACVFMLIAFLAALFLKNVDDAEAEDDSGDGHAATEPLLGVVEAQPVVYAKPI